jgi:hypothetical protein
MKNTEKTNETRRIPALLVLAALSAIVLAPVTAQSVSGDFEVNGTVLVKYRGSEENVVIPDYLGLTEIGLNAFRGTKVKSVTIPPGVTSIGGSAFSDCGDLTGISIPEGVSFIDHNAFQHCYRLEELTLPASLTTLGSGYIPAIYNCSALRAVHVREGNRHFTSMKGVLFTGDMKTLIKYPARMPDTEYAIPGTVTTIEDHAFDDSRNLRVLLIPPSVTCINGTNTFSNSYSFRVFRVDPANPAFADVTAFFSTKK